MEITNPTLDSESEYISIGYEVVVDSTEIVSRKISLKIPIQEKHKKKTLLGAPAWLSWLISK